MEIDLSGSDDTLPDEYDGYEEFLLIDLGDRYIVPTAEAELSDGIVFSDVPLYSGGECGTFHGWEPTQRHDTDRQYGWSVIPRNVIVGMRGEAVEFLRGEIEP